MGASSSSKECAIEDQRVDEEQEEDEPSNELYEDQSYFAVGRTRMAIGTIAGKSNIQKN
jgi:hypothetical protein